MNEGKSYGISLELEEFWRDRHLRDICLWKALSFPTAKYLRLSFICIILKRHFRAAIKSGEPVARFQFLLNARDRVSAVLRKW